MKRLSRRALLASLAGLPVLAACRAEYPDAPVPVAKGIASIATPTPSEPRPVRIGRPDLDLFAFWSTRFQNLNHRLNPERNVKLTTAAIGVGAPTAMDLPAAYAQALGALSGSEVPDLVMSGPEEINALSALTRAGVLHDLGPILKAESWFRSGDFHSNLLRAGLAQGKQSAIPLSVGAEVMAYSKRRFDEAGLEPPPAGWRWDTLVGIAKTLTRPASGDTPPRWGLHIGRASPTFVSLAWQHGAEVVAEDGARIRLDEPGTIQAIELLRDFVHTHKIAAPPDATAQLWNRMFRGLSSGESAMGSFVAGGAVFWRGFGDIQVTELPTTERRVILGTTPLLIGIPAKAPDLKHSLNALRAMVEASPDGMFLPPVKGTRDIRRTDSLMLDSEASAYVSALDQVRFLSADTPLHAYPAIEAEFLFPVLRGERKTAEAAQSAQKILDAMMKPAG